MSRESDWASVREGVRDHRVGGAGNDDRRTTDSRPTFVAEVFRSVHEALNAVADEMPNKDSKPGF